jgi:hypothetical protein
MLYRVFLNRPIFCRITDALIGTRKIWCGSVGTIKDARDLIKNLDGKGGYDPCEDVLDVEDENGQLVVWWEPALQTFLTSPTPDVDDLDSIPF